MKFEKCAMCGKYALMDKSICNSCFGKYILKLAWLISTGKIKIPPHSKFIDELKEYDSLP